MRTSGRWWFEQGLLLASMSSIYLKRDTLYDSLPLSRRKPTLSHAIPPSLYEPCLLRFLQTVSTSFHTVLGYPPYTCPNPSKSPTAHRVLTFHVHVPMVILSIPLNVSCQSIRQGTRSFCGASTEAVWIYFISYCH